jgi:hypothetical protein
MVAAGGKRKGEGQAQGPGYRPDGAEEEQPAGVATVAEPEPVQAPPAAPVAPPAPAVAAPPPPSPAPPPASAPPPGF